jgi:1-deoxy-D-xylulose-5-phosphate reductoisomerase
MKRQVIILGSTGSIGTSTLEVIANQPDDFEVVGIVCGENTRLFSDQIKRFTPPFACLFNETLKDKVDFGSAKPLVGPDGLKEMMKVDANMVVNALPGSVGLEPSLEALTQNRVLALANKESLVMAGRLIKRLTEKGQGTLIPVDSEHSALFQLLEGIGTPEIEKLVITASGGPFRNHSKEHLVNVTPGQALRHPTWNMGRKVTIDSATFMNKALELIEAHWLFDVPPSKLGVLVHPESVVHGMVQCVDGSFFAYLSHPDMKIPIAYALNMGNRVSLPFGRANLVELSKLSFYEPDKERFPAIRLAYQALDVGDSASIVLNAANELAAAAFLDGLIPFTSIAEVVEDAIDKHSPVKEIENLEEIREIHGWAQAYVESSLRRKNAF